jgi:hypothetical protein
MRTENKILEITVMKIFAPILLNIVVEAASTYHLVNAPSTYAQASLACETYPQGTLAKISSKAAKSAVKKLLAKN